MSDPTKEEESLLQDASTLLMFANVAAQQQQERSYHTPSPHSVPKVTYQHAGPQQPVNNHVKVDNSEAIQQPNSWRLPHDDGKDQRRSTSPFGQPSAGTSKIDSMTSVSPNVAKENRDPPSLSSEDRAPSSENLQLKSAFKESKSKDQHRRSSSTPDLPNTSSSYHIHRSPGPASLALARGINLETGERSNNNAMIAAAALAAAADIPLPLKQFEQLKRKQEQRDEKERQVKNERESEIKEEKEGQNEKEIDIEKHTNTADKGYEKENINKNDREVEKGINNERNSENESEKHNESDVKVRTPPEDQLTEPEPEETDVEEEVKFKAEPKFDSKRGGATLETEAKEKDNIVNIRPPPLERYKVAPDSGLIGCICGIDEDDGFTIQCDICFRWQHCVCMGFDTNEEIPDDEYKCYFCDESKWGVVDVDVLRDNTLKRLPSTQQTNDNKPNNKRKQSAGKTEKQDKKRKASNGVPSSPSQVKFRESFQEQRKPPEAEPEVLPNPSNELLEEGVAVESYQSVYYNLRSNEYKCPEILNHFQYLGRQFHDHYLKSTEQEQRNLDVKVLEQKDVDSLSLCQLNLPTLAKVKDLKDDSSNINSREVRIQVKSYNENQKQKFNGIAKLGLFIEKPQTTKSSIEVPSGTNIIEYLGVIDLFDNYGKDPINQYALWGTSKPRVARTYIPFKDRKVDVVIDSRFVGNESRFIRKSCPSSANCKIEKIYVPSSNSFKFIVVTTKSIKLSEENRDEELRIEWDWDKSHPISKFYEESDLKFDTISEQDKAYLISNVDRVLHFVDCGCSTSEYNGNCAISKIKKITSYLMRSSRKASSISNINLSKSKEELIASKKPKEYKSWKTRLDHRDEAISFNLALNSDAVNGPQKCTSESPFATNEQSFREKPTRFKIPYHHQIVKTLGAKQKLDPQKSKSDSHEYLKEGLPVPLTPELAKEIQQSVNMKLKIEPRKMVLPEPSENEMDYKDKSAKSDIVSNSPSSTSKIEPPKKPQEAPGTGKKLSFADYKKKMK